MNKYILRRIRGKRIIGSGARRIVYHWNERYVFKVAKGKCGQISNRKEVKLYRSVPRRLRRHLGKITNHGSGWLVMKKYTRPFPESKKYRRKLRRLKKRFLRYGILPYEMYSSRTHRPNGQNLRLDRKGKLIVIDYGNFVFRRKRSEEGSGSDESIVETE